MTTRQEVIRLQKEGRALEARTVGGSKNAGTPGARYQIVDVTWKGRPEVLHESRYRTTIMHLLHGTTTTLADKAGRWPEEIHEQYEQE